MPSTPFTDRFIEEAIRGTSISSISQRKREFINRRLLPLAARVRPRLDFTPFMNPRPASGVRRRATQLAGEAAFAEEMRAFAGINQVPVPTPVQPTPTCLVLSGGGFKGSYEAGFLKYFERVWDDFNVETVVGTSVGAVNAVALANEGKAGIARLADLWMSLEKDADMYTLHAGLEEIDGILEPVFGKGIEDLISDGLSGVDNALFDYFQDELMLVGSGLGAAVIGPAFGGPFGPVFVGLGLLLGGLGADQFAGSVNQLSKSLRDAIDKLMELPSIYEFGPLEDTLTAHINGGQLGGSGLPKLRLAMVQLEDGSIYYFSEDFKLMKGHPDSDKAVQTWDLSGSPDLTAVVVKAVLASSSPPALFPPVLIEGDGPSPHVGRFIDGGVRELLPLRAAFEMDYRRIVSILTSPPIVPEWQAIDGSPTLSEVLERTLPIMLGEIVDNDLAESLRRENIELINNYPRVEVFNDAFNVDPGLIRINMAYGYMQGWAATLEAAGKIFNPWTPILAALIIDELINARRKVWKLEIAAHRVPNPMVPGYDPQVYHWEPALLDQVRELKLEILKWTELLYQIDPDAIPLWMRPSDWWRKFERHKTGTWAAKLDTLSPFSPQMLVIPGGLSLEPASSILPVPESRFSALR